MIRNGEEKIIGEADFNLAVYSQPAQVNDKVMLEPKDDPGSFQLVRGQDHIEIVVKTVDMGDSQTPGSTNSLSLSNRSSNRLSNRNSGRRGTTMSNMPFIPESPSANGAAA